MVNLRKYYNDAYIERRTRTVDRVVKVISPDGEDDCNITFKMSQFVEEDGYIDHEKVIDYTVRFRPDWLTEEIINQIKTELNEQ